MNFFFNKPFHFFADVNYFQKKERASLSQLGKALRDQRNGLVCRIQLATMLVL